MRVDNRLNPEDSNNEISKLILNNPNFLISRVGLGGETAISALTIANQQVPPQVIQWFTINAGFYGSSDYKTYSFMYKNSCEISDLHAYWSHPGFIELEDFLVPSNKKLLDPSSLESFRFNDPWTKNLKGKKVLVISPFKETIESQLKNKDKIWENKDILPDCEFIIYKSVQSIGGIGPHESWYKSFHFMCDEISKIDFDIALLGCGSYGMPLCGYIKERLKKSAIYIGGGLQLYFGIKGKRWDNSPDITKFYNEYWVRPNNNETPQSSKLVEGGCYW